MKDRVPTYPGRVRLTPVPGQENVFDMTREDKPQQEGDPLNKNTFLKDSTAAIFGLGPDALPDDVLGFLGKYNQYAWERRTKSYTETRTPVNSYNSAVVATASAPTVQYSSSIAIDANGNVSLVNPASVTLNVSIQSSYTNLTSNAPCYVYSNNLGGVYYLPSGATGGGSSSDTIWLNTSNSTWYFGTPSDTSKRASKVTAVLNYSESEFLFSDNRNAYPDSGVSGGYEYEYIGVPYENILTAPRIEIGTYTGTGTYGNGQSGANMNSLTFKSVPRLVFVGWPNSTISHTPIIAVNGGDQTEYYSRVYAYDNSYNVTVSYKFDGNKLTWYNGADASRQNNASGVVYNYFAIY